MAALRVDLRGCGDSDGILKDEYLKLEQDDAIAIIEWAAQQPWCNGNVGMTGLSWGGFASFKQLHEDRNLLKQLFQSVLQLIAITMIFIIKMVVF